MGRLRVAGAELADSIQVRLQRMFTGSRYHAPSKSVLVPLPVKHGESLDDAALIEWTSGLLVAIFAGEPTPAAPAEPGGRWRPVAPTPAKRGRRNLPSGWRAIFLRSRVMRSDAPPTAHTRGDVHRLRRGKPTSLRARSAPRMP